MKILIIPDIHGRDFWIEPCKHIDEFDKVIFLGDYHDPYSNLITNFTPELFDKYKIQYKFYDDLIKAVSLDNLKNELYPFVKEHEDKYLLSEDIPYVKLDQVSWLRGGSDPVGSCVWCDVREYINSPKLPELYQIFGHTQTILITPEFACLDCQKAFTLDTETKTLIEFKNESKSN